MTPAGIKTETPTTTPTYLWTNRVGISHSKGRIIHHLRMMDHHSDHLSVFIHFHEGFTMGWFHSSHEPPRPIAQPTATGEVVNYIKFCEAIDRVQPKPWLLLIVDDVDVGSSRRDVLCCFFWKLCNTMTTTGLFVSDGESEVLGKTTIPPRICREVVPTWTKISDLEAIGIHTHDSHTFFPPRHLTSPGENLLLARRSCAKQDQHFKNLC